MKKTYSLEFNHCTADGTIHTVSKFHSFTSFSEIKKYLGKFSDSLFISKVKIYENGADTTGMGEYEIRTVDGSYYAYELMTPDLPRYRKTSDILAVFYKKDPTMPSCYGEDTSMKLVDYVYGCGLMTTLEKYQFLLTEADWNEWHESGAED